MRLFPEIENSFDNDPALDRRVYEELPPEELSHEIEKISAEGIPADPQTSPRQIGAWIAVCIGVLLLAGLVAGALVDPTIGLTIAIASLVVFAFNPELWANVQRAKERREAQHRVEHHTPPLRPV